MHASPLFFHRLVLRVLISRHDDEAAAVSSSSPLFARKPRSLTHAVVSTVSVASLKLSPAVNARPPYIFDKLFSVPLTVEKLQVAKFSLVSNCRTMLRQFREPIRIPGCSLMLGYSAGWFPIAWSNRSGNLCVPSNCERTNMHIIIWCAPFALSLRTRQR